MTTVQAIPRVAFDSENAFDKIIDGNIELSKDDEPTIQSRGRESIGGDGVNVVYAQDFTEEIRRLQFRYITQTVRDQLFFWLNRFGIAGDTFRYYPDNTDLTRYYDCKLTGNRKQAKFRRWHPNIVEYQVDITIRVVGVSAAIQADRDAVFP